MARGAFDELLDWVFLHGRLGGLALAGLGLILGGVTVADALTTGGFFVVMAAASVLFIGLGGLLAVFGTGESGGRFVMPEPKPLSPELEQALRERPKPFYVCTRCRHIQSVYNCELCLRSVDCVEVRDDDDLGLAIAAME
ncbi:MAG: hypothetical protein H6739_15275 [Alphaproteobacteria bacterium]|nr:hypothetical protein [Alphaproteobacteria bacterium]